MKEHRDLVDFDGKPKRQSPSPVIVRSGSTSAHTVLDVSFSHHHITCKCGWHWAGRSVLEVETRWKLHKKETVAA